jgi:hypothetical protein
MRRTLVLGMLAAVSGLPVALAAQGQPASSPASWSAEQDPVRIFANVARENQGR